MSAISRHELQTAFNNRLTDTKHVRELKVFSITCSNNEESYILRIYQEIQGRLDCGCVWVRFSF